VTLLIISMGWSHITMAGGAGRGRRPEDRLHRQTDATRAPPRKDRRPGDSPGPPGRDARKTLVELLKSRSNKNSLERRNGSPPRLRLATATQLGSSPTRDKPYVGSTYLYPLKRSCSEVLLAWVKASRHRLWAFQFLDLLGIRLLETPQRLCPYK